MSYINAKEILPKELLEQLQKYVEGNYLYIPRKEELKKAWGTGTQTKRELSRRNEQIYLKYIEGVSNTTLAETYFLSVKSIQRIITNAKKEKI